MNTKTVCPRDCPGRYPGCGANCETFKAHRAKRAEVYKQRLYQQNVKDAAYGSWNKQRGMK